jgi:ornithine carbamoyltransferase
MSGVVEKKVNLKGKDLLTLADFSKEEILYLLDYAVELKQQQKSGEKHLLLEGKTLGMVFAKSSTRTRISFEAGMNQLGGTAMFLNQSDMQMGRGESIADTAKVLSRYLDAIMIRTYEHSIVEELALHADIPIINGLTDDFHPCQALADLLTIYEEKGTFAGKKIVYVGDGNNVAHSLMIAAAKVGLDCAIATPKNYEPSAKVVEMVQQFTKESGSQLLLTNDPIEAVKDADVIYTDVWTSMGWESENEQRLKDFASFQVNQELVKHAKSDYSFLHCLPAHRGEEVTAEIIDGPNSVVFDEAENRLHAQKAVLASLL